jgi:hypothetical protein
MLIVLSDELRSSGLMGPLEPTARDALINLSTAVYEGKHLVTGSRLTFGLLKQNTELGSVACNRFRAASSLITDAEALRPLVSAYILVHPMGRTPCVEVCASEDQMIFHLPLDHFADMDRTGSSWLVAEESYDLTVYRSLGDAFGTQYRGFRCVLRSAVGHGGDTHQTFAQLAQDSCVVCIVDSDRAAADAPVGNTAAKTLARLAELTAQGKVAAVHVLPCHELENLLPASLVLASLPTDPRDQERAKLLTNQACLGLVDHTDLKKLTSPRILEWVCAHIVKITEHKLAETCCSSSSHPALLAVSKLPWSFGLAPKPHRT